MVYQFYVMEIQQYADLSDGDIKHFAYDENPDKARLKAEAKYHEVLAAAAVSELPEHSASLLSSEGRLLMNQSYKHEVQEQETEPAE